MMLFVEIMTMLDFVICRNGHIKEPVWSELGHVSGQRETAPIWTLDTTAELEKYRHHYRVGKYCRVEKLQGWKNTAKGSTVKLDNACLNVVVYMGEGGLS